MSSKSLLLVTLGLLLTFAAPSTLAEGLVPHGWTMVAHDESGSAFTRPDLPGVWVGIIDDVRPDVPPEKKFEHALTFFSERLKVPSLKKAKVTKSFAGFSAESEGPFPRCRLLAMGHWKKGGLQIAAILDRHIGESTILGGFPNGKEGIPARGIIPDGIRQDFVELFMMRYHVGEKGLSLEEARKLLSAKGYAGLVPLEHRPHHLVRLFSTGDGGAIENPIAGEASALVLFGTKKGWKHATAVPRADWDPALMGPHDTNMIWHQQNQVRHLFWRWEEGQDGKRVEVRGLGVDDPWSGRELVRGDQRLEIGELYRPFPQDAKLDLTLGPDREKLEAIAGGKRPLAELSPHALIIRPDGRFLAGTLISATLPGGKSKGPVKGQIHLDLHVVTLLLDGGRVVHGFAGWLPGPTDRPRTPGAPQEGLDDGSAVFINGRVYASSHRDG